MSLPLLYIYHQMHAMVEHASVQLIVSVSITGTKTDVEPERALFQMQMDCVGPSGLQPVLKEDWEVCLNDTLTHSSALRFLSYNNLLQSCTDHFFTKEETEDATTTSSIVICSMPVSMLDIA